MEMFDDVFLDIVKILAIDLGLKNSVYAEPFDIQG